MKRFSMLVLFILMAGLLVACGGGDDADTNVVSVDELTQSIQYSDLAQSYILTVNYPEGWFASNGADLGIGISNNEATMELLLNSQRVAPAENVITGNILFSEFRRLENVGVNSEMSPSEILPAYTLGVFGVGINADDVEEVEINGITVVSVAVESDGSAVQFILKKIDGGIVVSFMGTIEGGLDQYRDTILAIVANAEVELNN